MNKTTIKISVLAFLGFMTYGYAQQQQQDPYKGKVGINTIEPSATMDVQPNSDNARVEAKTNEGIIAPKLSKTRIANIATPVEGTLVYATDDATSPISAYTGGDMKVAKITEKGYYFYNGTEWVKAGSEVTDQLWAQRDNGGVTETYLKPADGNGDEYVYSPKRNYINLGNASFDLVAPDGLVYNNIKKDTPNLLMINSSSLPTGETAVGPFGKRYSYFSRDIYTIDNTFTPDSGTELVKYRGKDIWMLAKDLTHDIDYLIGQNIGNDFMSSTKASNLTGTRVYSTLGDINGTYTPTVRRNAGVHSFPAIYSGKVSSLVGSFNTPTVYGGTVDYIYGIQNSIETSSLHKNVTTTHAVRNLKDVIGIKTDVTNQQNSTTERLLGSLTYTNYKEGSTVNQGFGAANSAYIQAGSTIGSYSGFSTYIHANGAANVTDLYAFKFESSLASEFVPTNMYGLYLADVKKASQKNFAIYANEGNIRFGDLKHTNNNNTASTGDRPVFVTADGVLKVGNASTALARAVWETDGNHVKLAVKADGTDRTDNIITINDAGQMFASSFKGTNGATIFPDYVFQKYYTGTSSIKADYNFKSLSQVEDFVKANGHLPGYKSAETIKAQGYVDLMETQLTNVEKIEELYLHSIEQDKALKAKDAEIADLKQRLERLEKLIQ
ncbi:hypothetical protein [Bergeyella zoohelcum]|uniref:Uncharacterized protein n=1 Tax=Bergeyella zoohelcum TaxID=1015 RepID=A0A7Z8YMM5_9FLAO|nr:hypothetical protein [Bergeyella zoohelcum]VDH03278.1 Uncharacterised protein [Bergeyella zoohelcum]